MSDEQLYKLAADLANEAILNNFWFYFLLFCISIVSSASVHFVGSYFRKRGENYATKQDFNNVLNQLKQTTTTTEEIKTTIQSDINRKEETRKIIRDKLEEIFQTTYELELWHEQSRSRVIAGVTFDINTNPIYKIELLRSLYFTDLSGETDALKQASFDMLKWLIKVHSDVLAAKQNVLTGPQEIKYPEIDYKKFGELQIPINTALADLRGKLIDNYAEGVGL